MIINKMQKSLLIAMTSFVMVSTIITAPSALAATPANWSANPGSPDTAGWQDITWSPELKLFVAVGTSNIMTSSDGINWVSRHVDGIAWRTVAWSPDKNIFVVLSASSNSTVLTSPDGINWTPQPLTVDTTRTWNAVMWSPDHQQFVAVGLATGSTMTSPDGITWTRSGSGNVSTAWGIARSSTDNLYIATSTSASGIVYRSSDGINWTPQSGTPVINLRDITYAPDKDLFVVTGVGGGIMTSPDGITWTSRTTPVTSLSGVTYSPQNGEFVAVGTDSIVTSPDGITWTSVTPPVANLWKSIVWAPELSRYASTATTGTVETNRTMVGFVPIATSAPLDLTAVQNGQDIDLSWTPPSFDGNSAITGYRIERSVNEGVFSVLVADTASAETTYKDEDVLEGTAYTYRIYALNAEGQSVASNTASVQTAAMLAETGVNQYVFVLLAFSAVSVACFAMVAFRKRVDTR